MFDFESPGAVSTLLVEALAKASLPVLERNRHHELWSALVEKALSYDADGGEITRAELVKCLTHERGLNVVAGRGMALARQRFAAHSAATLAAIDDRIAGIALDRSSTVEAIAKALDVGRFVEIVGNSGSGKSALLKALAEEERLKSRPKSGRLQPAVVIFRVRRDGLRCRNPDALGDCCCGAVGYS